MKRIIIAIAVAVTLLAGGAYWATKAAAKPPKAAPKPHVVVACQPHKLLVQGNVIVADLGPIAAWFPCQPATPTAPTAGAA